MSLPTYSTGTVAVAAGGTVVTCSGGMWSGINARQGDFISIAGSSAQLITEVTDATHLKIAPWQGAAQTAGTYVIYQNYAGRVVGVAAAEDVGVMLEKLHTDGLPFLVGADETVPDPSFGDDGQYAYSPTTGQWWIKTAGVWTPTTSPANAGAVMYSGPQTLTGAQQQQAQDNIGLRETLTSARGFYVATTGNDSNDGSSGAPFLTLQAAVDAAHRLDFNGQLVIIQIADGTYNTGGTDIRPWVGGGQLYIQGNTTTPANVVLNMNAAGNGIVNAYGFLPGEATITGVKFTGSQPGAALYATVGAILYFDHVEFGAMHATGGGHIATDFNGQVIKNSAAPCTISGGGLYAWHANNGGSMWINNTAFTLTGTPHFGSFFAGVAECGRIYANNNTYTGAATGRKFLVHNDGMLNTQAAITQLPGDIPGDLYQENGGIYVAAGETIDFFARGDISWNGTAWTAYTPAVAAGSGAITSYTAAGRYKKFGKMVAFQIGVTFTNPGTLATYFVVSPPLAPFASSAIQYSSLVAYNVSALVPYNGFISNNFSIVGVPAAGQTVVCSGIYETSE
jgi:hypothetical protein